MGDAAEETATAAENVAAANTSETEVKEARGRRYKRGRSRSSSSQKRCRRTRYKEDGETRPPEHKKYGGSRSTRRESQCRRKGMENRRAIQSVCEMNKLCLHC